MEYIFKNSSTIVHSSKAKGPPPKSEYFQSILCVPRKDRDGSSQKNLTGHTLDMTLQTCPATYWTKDFCFVEFFAHIYTVLCTSGD